MHNCAKQHKTVVRNNAVARRGYGRLMSLFGVRAKNGAAKMARDRVNTTQWDTGPGGLVLTITAIGVFDFSGIVSLRSLQGIEHINPTHDDASVSHYTFTEQHVALLRSEPTMERPPYIKITFGAYLSPAAPDRRWGWKYRLSRSGDTLPCIADYGKKNGQDAAGFLKREPRTFPEGKSVDGEFDFITLI